MNFLLLSLSQSISRVTDYSFWDRNFKFVEKLSNLLHIQFWGTEPEAIFDQTWILFCSNSCWGRGRQNSKSLSSKLESEQKQKFRFSTRSKMEFCPLPTRIITHPKKKQNQSKPNRYMLCIADRNTNKEARWTNRSILPVVTGIDVARVGLFFGRIQPRRNDK